MTHKNLCCNNYISIPCGQRGPRGVQGPPGPTGPCCTGTTGIFIPTFNILGSGTFGEIGLNTDYTFFDNPLSFNLGFENLGQSGAIDLPVYDLPNPTNFMVKNLALLNPLSGNVKITTELGSFNLDFTNDNSRLVFVNGQWVNLDNEPWYPDSQQGNKLVGTGPIGSSLQGNSVSLSADGNTLAVGGPNDGGGTGATWIFTRSVTTWTQQGSKLVGSGFTGPSEQGSSVSVSADGSTLAVGGRGDGSGKGATWIFTRVGTTWTEQAKLVGMPNVGGSEQGSSVSLSANGNILAVGGQFENTGIGATWIFTRSGATWSQQDKLVGTGFTGNSRQGTSVDLSADGNTLSVGGIDDNNGIGATWIFTRESNTWTQQAKLVGSGFTPGARQGISVSLSADGNTLAVGGKVGPNSIGPTWIFTRSGSIWTQQGNKLEIGATISNMGFTSVSLSADGNTLAVSLDIQETLIFTRTGTVWTQQGNKLVVTGSVGSFLPGIVSLSATGKTLAIGGQNDNGDIGATWIFV